MNISEFIEWFLTQFVNIGREILNILDNIIIYNNVSMLDFIITLAIISVFIGIIITMPQNINNRMKVKKERKIKNDKRSKSSN